jgi:cytosine/adenosine deaminase-related metal-dependent hydrolase
MAELPYRSLRARYVFAGLGPPIAGGAVTLCGPRIVAVGREARGDPEDLGNAAILPGLVNAHTHLELSDLDAPLGTPGMSLVDWIGLVIAHRQRRPPLVDGPEGESPIFASRKAGQSPVAKGIAESRRLGATSLGEIAQPDVGRIANPSAQEADRPDGLAIRPTGKPTAIASPLLGAARIDATVFLELIAPIAARVDAAIELARSHLDRTRHAPRDARPHAEREEYREYGLGLAPHAPYSVHPELLRRVVRLAQVEQSPVAFHLAESREELELLETGRGSFRQMLRKMGAWEDQQFPGPRRPLDYLQELVAAPRTLVIHGNYLREDEIRFLAQHADRMSLVYCPRTHAFFRHAPYPLAELLDCGVTMALGTDSRASSPDLSILAEMRFLARQHPEIARPTILRLGTLGGARALGVDRSVGTLEPGKLAHLAVVALPERDAADAYDLLFESDAPVIGRWWRGEPDATTRA